MSLIKNIFLIVFFSCVTLKIADLVFGLLQPDEFMNTSINKGTDRTIVLRELNRNQSATLFPSNQYMKDVDSLQQKGFEIITDSNGFIENGNISQENPEIRIIFLGGSTTEALFVETKNRFPSIVERNLRKELNRTVVVHNSGVSGNNSMHSNLVLAGKGIPLKPNFAVLMHNINDLSLLSKTASYWIAPSSRTLINENNRFVNTLEDSSRSYTFYVLKSIKNILFPNLYAYLFPRLFPNIYLHRDEFEGFRNKLLNDHLDEIENQFISSITTFINLSRAWNIEPILMTQFNRINIDDIALKRLFKASPNISLSPEEFVSSYKKFNKIIRDVAKQNDVLLIDLAVLIPSSEKFLYDTVHLNDEGSIKAGELISNHLIEIISDKSE
jgi:hypothetical protein